MCRFPWRLSRPVLVSSLAVCLAGCVGHASLLDDPLLVILKQQSAWNSGDIVGFMAGYHRSDDTTFLSTGGLLRGWSAVLDRYRQRYPDAAAMGKLTFSELRAQTVSSRVVIVTGRYDLRREKDAPAGVFTLVLQRFGEGWRIVHDHTSSFPAPIAASP